MDPNVTDDDDHASQEEGEKGEPPVFKPVTSRKSDVPEWASTVNVDKEYRMGAYNNVRSPNRRAS